MENKTIDYERAFKKIAEQVRLELSWAKEDNREMPKRTFQEGMRFAYSSIEELITGLENGEFYYLNGEEIEDDYDEDSDY